MLFALLLSSSLFPLPFSLAASAASLTLASTNDYKFVSMPTNWTPQIVGLGCGPDDKSAAIRAEDVFFLNEAMLEREFVANALRLQATTNSQPYRTTVFALATPIPMSSHMLELGNASTNLFSGTITSNAVGFVTAPKEIHEDPAQHFGAVSSSLDFGHFMTNFYTAGKTQSSHRYYDFNVDAIWKTFGSISYPYPMIVRGVCTNLYHDLAANTFVSFIQQMRTGPSGIQSVIGTTKINDEWAVGYSDRDDEFNFDPGGQDERRSAISSAFSTSYERVLELNIASRRSAYVGLKGGEERKRGSGTQQFVTQTKYTGTFSFTYSDPICGSHVTDIRAAFAVLNMYVDEYSLTNGYTRAILRKVSRKGIYPISFSQGPSDPHGCPSCTFTIDGEDVLGIAMNLFGERIKSPDVLLARCPEVDYPPRKSSTVFHFSENTETYDIEVSIPYVIAVAEVDFRAKERNNR